METKIELYPSGDTVEYFKVVDITDDDSKEDIEEESEEQMQKPELVELELGEIYEDKKDKDDREVCFKFSTCATTRSPQQFSTFGVWAAFGDSMETTREWAWSWCHFAADIPFPENKLSNSPLNVVLDGKKNGEFVKKHNELKVGVWLELMDIDMAEDIMLIMPFSTEVREEGRGPRQPTRPAPSSSARRTR